MPHKHKNVAEKRIVTHAGEFMDEFGETNEAKKGPASETHNALNISWAGKVCYHNLTVVGKETLVGCQGVV